MIEKTLKKEGGYSYVFGRKKSDFQDKKKEENKKKKCDCLNMVI